VKKKAHKKGGGECPCLLLVFPVFVWLLFLRHRFMCALFDALFAALLTAVDF